MLSLITGYDHNPALISLSESLDILEVRERLLHRGSWFPFLILNSARYAATIRTQCSSDGFVKQQKEGSDRIRRIPRLASS